MEIDITTLIERFDFQPIILEGSNAQGNIVNPYPSYAEELGVDLSVELTDDDIALLTAKLEDELGLLGFELIYQEGDFDDEQIYIQVQPIVPTAAIEEVPVA